MRSVQVVLSMLILALSDPGLFAAPATGARGSIVGQVKTSEGSPAGEVPVVLAELRWRTITNDQGEFRFADVPAGAYLLQAVSPRHGSGVQAVVVGDGADVTVEIRLDLTIHKEKIVVSAGPGPRSTAETAQPVAVVDREEIAQRLSPSLGESLSHVPGVNATYYSPAASRPIIRGQGGDRIRILDNGLGVGDASNVSPDHALALDPLASERVEIVRGPATLLYGSEAIAGVINVLNARIPDHVADKPIGGDVLVRGGSVDDDLEGALALRGGVGSFAWHLDGLTRETDDFETPAGTVANSATETDSVGLGASWVGDSGYVGASFSTLDSLYGIAVEEDVTIDLDQRRVDVEGAWLTPFGPFRRLVVRAGRSDYEHIEFEGPDPGTIFLNDEWEGRLELSHRPLRGFAGSFGLQLREREFEAIGDEAFIRPNESSSWALFAFEELTRGPLQFQFGGRYENQEARTSDPGLEDRDFDGLTGSFGLVWTANEAWGIGASLTRATRFPTVEELYSDGPHIATLAFEVGDDDLGKETSLGLDFSLRKKTGRVTGEVTLFEQRYDDFIYDRDTGELDPEEGLPIFQYVQEDAQFYGAEAHLDFGLLHSEPHHVQLELRADYVRAELRDSGESLPRIPPLRVGVGLSYQGAHLWSRAEVAYVAEQDRVATIETVTTDHTLVDVAVGYRFFPGATVHELILRGKNLTDELAYNHASRFKEQVPLAGRDISLIYRLTF